MAKSRAALIIGDLHGRLARLEALLLQEGILGPCPLCAASGDVSDGTGEAELCPECDGNGLSRIDYETEVLQVGDLIDCNLYRTSHTADEMTAIFADKWVDTFLWGNHERPFAPGPTFGGYSRPLPSTLDLIDKWKAEGRYHLAAARHGHLITHAGLSDQAFTGRWVDDDTAHAERTGSLKRYDVERLAAWINRKNPQRPYIQKMWDGFGWDLRDNISFCRGGPSTWGGLIWRDSREGLWGVPQVFGHSSHQVALEIEHGPENSLKSYCIDTSKHGRVSAIWLPELRVVTIDDTEDQGL